MKSHINKTAAVCFYHLRRLKSLRHKIGQELTTRLVLAIIITRLDYCNSLFAGLPQSTLAPLQRVQNAAARLVFNLRRYDHITPALIQLHWLPVYHRITFKLCVFMFNLSHGHMPPYIANNIVESGKMSTRSGLRSSTSNTYSLPRLRTKFAERCFSFSGPTAWNSLPSDIRDEPNFTTFKRLLKTHLFKKAFNLL